MARKSKKKHEVQAELPEESGGKAKSGGVINTLKRAGASAVDAVKNPAPLVEAMRDKIVTAAEAVDRTLETLKQALENVDDKVIRAQEWTTEKVERLEATLDTMRETVASAESLVESTQMHARRLTDIASEKLQAATLDDESTVGAGSAPQSEIERSSALDEEFEMSRPGRLDPEPGLVGAGSLAPETGTPLDIEESSDLDVDIERPRTGRPGGGRDGDGLI